MLCPMILVLVESGVDSYGDRINTKKRKEKSYLAESGVDSYDSYLAESGIRVKFKI